MSVYVYFKRRIEDGIHLPNFELHDEMPVVEERDKRRVHQLEDGECIHGGKFNFSKDLTYIECIHFRVSNIGGVATVEQLENYTLPRYGR